MRARRARGDTEGRRARPGRADARRVLARARRHPNAAGSTCRRGGARLRAPDRRAQIASNAPPDRGDRPDAAAREIELRIVGVERERHVELREGARESPPRASERASASRASASVAGGATATARRYCACAAPPRPAVSSSAPSSSRSAVVSGTISRHSASSSASGKEPDGEVGQERGIARDRLRVASIAIGRSGAGWLRASAASERWRYGLAGWSAIARRSAVTAAACRAAGGGSAIAAASACAQPSASWRYGSEGRARRATAVRSATAPSKSGSASRRRSGHVGQHAAVLGLTRIPEAPRRGEAKPRAGPARLGVGGRHRERAVDARRRRERRWPRGSTRRAARARSPAARDG